MELLSIMGYDRSGTTFLGSYISSLSKDIFYAGEIDKGIEKFFSGKNKSCSCGELYSDCSLWGRIFPEMKRPSDLKFLFESLEEITGAKVIVDSSKGFAHIRKCKQLFKEEFNSIHIVRNPKGVMLSRKKVRKSRIQRKTHPKPGIAKHYDLMMVYDCIEWNIHNLWMERFKKRERNLDLFYDRLDTELSEKIEKFIEPLIENHLGDTIGLNHIVWGNRGRLAQNLNIVVNHQWKQDLNFIQKSVVDGITFPVKYFYNYKFRN